ncbi:MAG: hypothetical protein HPY74_07360 [Firmicutes bacterium]|nr:hypothetical protein [Bacillota bacterium]
MTRRERLMATIKGEKTDRPPVCFYEINGLDQDPDNKDRFNIYNDPSWYPLIKLAREKSDRIVLRGVGFKRGSEDPLAQLTTVEEFFDEGGSFYRSISIRAGDRILTRRTRRDPDIDTVWTLEHPVKDIEDFKAWINLPQADEIGEPDISPVFNADKEIGDSGIVAIDLADPLCEVAELFDMGDYTVMAMTEPDLFHKALEKVFENRLKKVEAIAKALPGRLWRICGPEYACPPYLPPKFFKEYAVRYDKPIIDIIKKYGGFPRIHCHGKIKEVLDDIVSTGCIGLDPIEPPPQGNVSLLYVRKNYGDKLVLFGNIELSDIETMESDEFEKKVITSLEEGTAGEGKGFVLMPTAAPIGRKLKPSTLKNYEKMVEIIERTT